MDTTQIAALAAIDRQATVAELLRRTRGYWPDQFAGDRRGPAEAQVREAASTARRLGFDTEFDISRFVQLGFMLRDGQFHLADWAGEELAALERMAPRAVMNRLVAAARARLSPASAGAVAATAP